jgi:arylsulfatase A-like enzyme
MTPYKPDDMDDVPAIGHLINDLPMMPTTDWAIENDEWANIIQAYLACISFVDFELGRLLDALERSKYAESTVIVLWSDHGYRMGEKGTFAKHALWETATRVPLIFAAPQLPKGKVITAPAEMLSIYPTLLNLCGLPAYSRNEGPDLVPRMMGEEPASAESFAITTFGMNNHGLRTSDYRYIRYEDGGEELYDHRNDPNEWFNLAGEAGSAGVIEDLEQKMPVVNVKWNVHSQYTFQPYFVEQKERTRKH